MELARGGSIGTRPAGTFRRMVPRPTLEGRWTLAVGLGVLVAAVNTGNNLLLAAASLLIALLLADLALGELNVAGVEVRRLLPDELFAGRAAWGSLEVQNRWRLVAVRQLVVREVPSGSMEVGDLTLGPGATERVPVAWRAHERGSLRLGRVEVWSTFPLGLVRHARVHDEPVEVLVFPLPLGGRRGRLEEGAGHEDRRDVRRDGRGELVGLRPYRPGDPLRQVHWKVTARVGRFMVAERDAEGGGRAWVTVTPEELEGEGREPALQMACGAVLDHLSEGRAVGLRVGVRALPAGRGLAHRKRLLAALARAPEPP